MRQSRRPNFLTVQRAARTSIPRLKAIPDLLLLFAQLAVPAGSDFTHRAAPTAGQGDALDRGYGAFARRDGRRCGRTGSRSRKALEADLNINRAGIAAVAVGISFKAAGRNCAGATMHWAVEAGCRKAWLRLGASGHMPARTVQGEAEGSRGAC